jgi:c-di-GMP-binding flagellar brake protein YcgR
LFYQPLHWRQAAAPKAGTKPARRGANDQRQAKLSGQVNQATDTRNSSDDGKYRIHARVEIAFVLRAIMKSTALVTAYIGQGKDFIVTAILGVDAENRSILIDSGSNPVLNERAMRFQHLNLVSSQDGVKVEFEVNRLEAASFEGRLAFRVPFPESLLKLQRREFYRLPLPVVQPLKCQIPLAGGGIVETVVGDISLGGISLMGQHADLDLQPGTIYENCRIVLPELGVIQTKLMVRNSFPVTLRNGAVVKRTGCAFVELPSNQQAMIQRYIIKLERDRRAKLVEPRL